MSFILRAKELARTAHSGQVRKYTKEEYFWHPFRVACDVMALDYSTNYMISAAFLHDTIEDTNLDYENIESFFNKKMADMVLGLTSYSKQVKSTASRHERKKMDLEYLNKQPNEVKVIKMLDRIDNLQDLSTFGEKDFRELYKEESKNLLAILGAADLQVAERLKKAIEQCE